MIVPEQIKYVPIDFQAEYLDKLLTFGYQSNLAMFGSGKFAAECGNATSLCFSIEDCV
jgi:hypothetical protein